MKRLLLLVALVAACHEKRTEVVVVVNQYGIVLGRDVDTFELIVKNDPSGQPFFGPVSYPLCPEGQPEDGVCKTLPLTATLIPGDHNPDDAVIVQALALRGGTQVIGDQATFHFIKHVSQRLDFVLYANCLNVDCTQQNSVCNYAGACVPTMPTSFNGEPQLDGLPPNLLPDSGNLGDGGRPEDMHAMNPDDMSVAPGDMRGASGDMRGVTSGDMRGMMSGDMAMSTGLQDMAMSTGLKDMAMSTGLHDMAMSTGLKDMAMSTGLQDMTIPSNPPSWQQQTHPSLQPGTKLRGVWGFDVNEVFVVGDHGSILHSLDGTTWNTEDINDLNWTTMVLNSVYGGMPPSLGVSHGFAPSGNPAYAVGNGGVVLQRNGGVPWNRIDNGQFSSWNLTGVWVDEQGNVWVVGTGSPLGLIAVWDGVGWNILCNSTGTGNDQWHGIWGRNSSDVYVAGDTGIKNMALPNNCIDDGSVGCQCPTGSHLTGSSTNTLGVSGSIMTNVAEWSASQNAIDECFGGSCVANGAAATLNGVWAADDGSYIIDVGAGGAMYVNPNGQSTNFSSVTSPTITALNGVWGVGPPIVVWAVGGTEIWRLN